MEHESRVIRLEGALNARELGGLPLKNGRIVKHGTLIRSGRLSKLTAADKKLLSEKWNVTTIVDLRNNKEISEHPDVDLEGARFHKISVISGTKEGISREDNGMEVIERAILRATRLHKNGGSCKLLESMYGDMAENEYCLERIREFFEILLEQNEGALIWHCTSGKDRTGVTGALLLYAIGADINTIKEDYLYTNIQNHNYREDLLQKMRERNTDCVLVEEMRVLESVDWNYIDNFFRTIERIYGNVDRFLEYKLGLTAERRERLIAMYTE